MGKENHDPETRRLQELVEELSAKIALLSISGTASSEELRKKALSTAKSVVATLETPEEAVMWWVRMSHVQRMALKLGVDLGIFHILCDAKRPITSQQLAQETNAEELLIIRLMRLLCSFNFAKEAGVHTYLQTPYSKAMTLPGYEGALIVTYDHHVTTQFPDYCKAKGYKCPSNGKDTTFQWAHNTPLTFFEKLHESASAIKSFNEYMGVIRSTRKLWADWYDVKSKLLDGFKESQNGTFMVDVGGGKGHDLVSLAERFPEMKGALVLQDLPTTIAELPEYFPAWIQTMGHNFFAEQPLKGAKVYFMHHILDDWSDSDCQRILEQLKRAMTPYYSRILINEAVLPDENCTLWFAAGDFTMMTEHGSKERTRSDWVVLIESVGLTVANIQVSPFEDDIEGIIEVVLGE